MGDRIDVPFIPLAENKRVNPACKEAYLTLHEKYIQYKIIANYSSDSNPEGLLKEYKCNARTTYRREDICVVEIFKDNKHNTWAVGFKMKGVDTPEWDFDSYDKAKELYDILTEYMISK